MPASALPAPAVDPCFVFSCMGESGMRWLSKNETSVAPLPVVAKHVRRPSCYHLSSLQQP